MLFDLREAFVGRSNAATCEGKLSHEGVEVTGSVE